MNTKQCSKCKKSRLLKFFAKRTDRPCGVQSRCKKCFRGYSTKLTKQRQQKGNKEAYRTYHRLYYYTPKGQAKAKRRRLKMYHLTLEQWEAKLKKQKYRCAICKCRLKVPYTDHDHATGQTRDILCGLCNCLLGFAKDNLRTLRRAIQYLIKHRRKHV
jgi:hypothetical protein